MDNLWIIYGSGWWLSHPSEKYECVNWDDDIPASSINAWENIFNVPKNQPVRFDGYCSSISISCVYIERERTVHHATKYHQ